MPKLNKRETVQATAGNKGCMQAGDSEEVFIKIARPVKNIAAV